MPLAVSRVLYQKFAIGPSFSGLLFFQGSLRAGYLTQMKISRPTVVRLRRIFARGSK
jgi:hypothetical protein